MSKCRTIDRLELTRKSSKYLRDRDNNPADNNTIQDNTTKQDSTIQQDSTTQQHGDICPKCGQRTLHHVEGCETCSSCGYSACSYVW